MHDKSRETMTARIIAIVMAVMIGIAFMPMLGGPANASAKINQNDIGSQLAKNHKIEFKNIGTSNSEWCKVETNSKAQARITGHVNNGKVFAGVFVDYIDEANMILSPKDSGMAKSDIDVTVNLKNYDVGLHTFYVFVAEYVSEGNYNYYQFKVNDVVRPITDKPNYNGVFDVYSKYFFYYPYNIAGGNTGYDLYIEYKKKGSKKWKRKGAMRKNMIKLATEQGYTFKGLTPNRKYNTRIRFGQTETNSEGKSKLILGPVKKTTTFKTGQKKKVKIKNISVKAVNVKYHKVRHPGYWNYINGMAFWHAPYTEKFYTYKIKVTVKLKKKPKAKGLWLNGRYLKGNKKKYTTKFTPYPNYSSKRPPKGFKKFKMAISSYQHKKYGGFAPLLKTKRKVR